MSRNGRFQYALNPVLLTRQWTLDALLLDLDRINGDLAACQKTLVKLRRDRQTAGSEWRRQVGAAHGLTVARFALVTQYLGELARQCLIEEKTVGELEQERVHLIDRVAAAKRAVEAVERHRDDERAQFQRAQMSGEFKHADDQWSTLQAHAINHDN